MKKVEASVLSLVRASLEQHSRFIVTGSRFLVTHKNMFTAVRDYTVGLGCPFITKRSRKESLFWLFRRRVTEVTISRRSRDTTAIPPHWHETALFSIQDRNCMPSSSSDFGGVSQKQCLNTLCTQLLPFSV